MQSLNLIFVFLVTLFVANPLSANSIEKSLTGSLSILGHEIIWSRKDDVFAIDGVKDARRLRIQFENGRERIVSPPIVKKRDGTRWESSELIRRIGVDTESPIRDVVEVPIESPSRIELTPDSVDSWHKLDRVSVPVRAALRSQLKDFAKMYYGRIHHAVVKFLGSKKSEEALPKFLRCLVLLDEAKKSANALGTATSFRDERVIPCLGLISPSTPAFADSLVNQPSPIPFDKVYFSFLDASRPLGVKPTFIIVHASQAFHYPATMKGRLEERVSEFRKLGGDLAFLIHNDNFNDATYFVRPTATDLSFYTETGKHPLCENCRDVTFAGGFVDWCLGLSIRSYIANYFRNHDSGDIRINLAVDSIYTEAKGPAGSEGAVTALAEIKKDGERAFVRKRLGQYFHNPKLKDVGQALCWVSDPENAACKAAAAGVLLSEVDGRDNDGKFYPFFNERRFKFQILMDGRELVKPLGDLASPRTITFNILTK